MSFARCARASARLLSACLLLSTVALSERSLLLLQVQHKVDKADATCHTAVPGDECYDHVTWAKETGIIAHPHLYPWLSVDSTFEDFQTHLHNTGSADGSCPEPCPACRDAAQGDECYGHVMWAMETGIVGHPTWYPGLTTSSSFRDFQAFFHETNANGGACPRPCSEGSSTPAPPACSTATEGDDCYPHVMWAKTEGVADHPDWYPGLTASSSLEEFQRHLHVTNSAGGVCPEPCEKVTSTAVSAYPTRDPADCQAVWEAAAWDVDGTSYSCGSRITYLQSEAGGGLTLHDAKFKVGLAYQECERCWPWPKFKSEAGQGATVRSAKRGIAIQNYKLSGHALQTLRSMVSWGYIWDFSPDETWPTGGPSLSEWESAGVHFMPMVWGERQLYTIKTVSITAGKKALLGFNEPNFPDQANLDPHKAASLWPQVEALAAAHGIDTIVSPAMNFAQIDPIWWLQTFLEACNGCRVDAIALHSYTCYGKFLKDHLDMYKVFGKPLWLTELACSDVTTPERLSAEGQAAYMKEAIPLLEQDPDVAYYSWFSYFAHEWAYAVWGGTNGDAGLIHSDGRMSELGAVYASFGTTSPEDVA